MYGEMGGCEVGMSSCLFGVYDFIIRVSISRCPKYQLIDCMINFEKTLAEQWIYSVSITCYHDMKLLVYNLPIKKVCESVIRNLTYFGIVSLCAISNHLMSRT